MKAESSKMGASRSLRPRKKAKLDADMDADSDYQESKEIQKIPKKRSNKAGKLAGLIDLPIDVLFEIFGHVRPFDLLRLARMTKEFRRLLMHKSSKSVWKTALQQITGLPECPAEMSEPQWVNLVFDPHCHVKRGKRAILISQLEKIKQEYVVIKDKDARVAFVAERRRRMAELGEVKVHYQYGQLPLLTDEKHARICADWALTQTVDRNSELQHLKTERRLELTQLGYGKDIEGIRAPDSLKNHDLVKKPQKLTERSTLFHSVPFKISDVRGLVWKNISPQIIQFMNEMRAKRLAREHAELVLERKPSAIAVFKEYKDNLLNLTDIMPEGLDFCDFHPVKAILEQPTGVLVDETSFTEIVPLLPDLIVNWRRTLDSQLLTILRRGLQVDKRRSRTHFTTWGFNFYDDDTFPSDDSEDSEPSLNKESMSTSDEAVPLEKLKLATTVFQCSACSKTLPDISDSDFEFDMDEDFFGYPHKSPPLFYPHVLGHSCLTRKMSYHYHWFGISTHEPASRLDNSDKIRRKWTSGPLHFASRMSNCANKLVKEAGLDPEKATAEDMDNLGDIWFACLECAMILVSSPKDCDKKYPHETVALTWRDAVEHYGRKHPNSKGEPRLKKLSAQELETGLGEYHANPMPSKNNADLALDYFGAVTDSDEKPDQTWICVHCRDTRAEFHASELDDVKSHITDAYASQSFYLVPEG
ncbi:hypothetical protein H0H81_002225 [Sphagnurus paluster]|uniref:F-box domain-containing protein n=1 Tax=Sphagnurus paluster TaxID=117069 RepID=A0A9P7K6E0_9AGAR|nr:hypothetical protein H0H81_002225 [Sphagnurus paluster]